MHHTCQEARRACRQDAPECSYRPDCWAMTSSRHYPEMHASVLQPDCRGPLGCDLKQQDIGGLHSIRARILSQSRRLHEKSLTRIKCTPVVQQAISKHTAVGSDAWQCVSCALWLKGILIITHACMINESPHLRSQQDQCPGL